MDLKKHITNVTEAEKELAAVARPTPLQRDALIRARIFKRVLLQCAQEAAGTAQEVAEVNAMIESVNAAKQ